MKVSHVLVPGSSFQAGSVGSLRYAVEIMFLAFSRPAGLSTAATDVAVLARKNTGFHPSSPTFLMGCAEPFGAAQEKKISALESCSATIWESIVGSDTSYDLSAIIMPALSPSPSRNPLT